MQGIKIVEDKYKECKRQIPHKLLPAELKMRLFLCLLFIMKKGWLTFWDSLYIILWPRQDTKGNIESVYCIAFHVFCFMSGL